MEKIKQMDNVTLVAAILAAGHIASGGSWTDREILDLYRQAEEFLKLKPLGQANPDRRHVDYPLTFEDRRKRQ